FQRLNLCRSRVGQRTLARIFLGARLHLLRKLLLLVQNGDAPRFGLLLHAQLISAPRLFQALFLVPATRLFLLLQFFLPQMLVALARLGLLARFFPVAQLFLAPLLFGFLLLAQLALLFLFELDLSLRRRWRRRFGLDHSLGRLGRFRLCLWSGGRWSWFRRARGGVLAGSGDVKPQLQHHRPGGGVLPSASAAPRGGRPGCADHPTT